MFHSVVVSINDVTIVQLTRIVMSWKTCCNTHLIQFDLHKQYIGYDIETKDYLN